VSSVNFVIPGFGVCEAAAIASAGAVCFSNSDAIKSYRTVQKKLQKTAGNCNIAVRALDDTKRKLAKERLQIGRSSMSTGDLDLDTAYTRRLLVLRAGQRVCRREARLSKSCLRSQDQD